MNIYIQKTDIHSTLTTYIYCGFAQAFSAEQLGHSFYFNWPQDGFLASYNDPKKFAEIPNGYDWYFKQPHNNIQRDATWVWENWVDPSPVPLMAQPLQVIKSFYKKHLHFSDAVEERGQALVKKYNIDFSNAIGITWRGTDIYLDGRPRIPIESYFPWIDEVLKPGMKILCTAEEEKILEPLFSRYPEAVLIEEFYSAPFNSKHNPERFSPFSGYERGMQPALMVWLFSKVAHYIKNRSSTGAVASWISDGTIVSIGHPETLGFPANTDTVEIEGKLYPMTR